MNSIFTPFPDTLWVRKEIKFGYSCSLCQIKSNQDLAEKALVPKLDSYNPDKRITCCVICSIHPFSYYAVFLGDVLCGNYILHVTVVFYILQFYVLCDTITYCCFVLLIDIDYVFLIIHNMFLIICSMCCYYIVQFSFIGCYYIWHGAVEFYVLLLHLTWCSGVLCAVTTSDMVQWSFMCCYYTWHGAVEFYVLLLHLTWCSGVLCAVTTSDMVQWSFMCCYYTWHGAVEFYVLLLHLTWCSGVLCAVTTSDMVQWSL